MGENEWPPEGTRVFIRDEYDPERGDVGELVYCDGYKCVRLPCGALCLVERHEIEVIEQEESQ